MCHRQDPYAGISPREQYDRQVVRAMPIIDDNAVPEKLREVIRACWQFDRSKRPTASTVVDWLLGNVFDEMHCGEFSVVKKTQS